MSDVHKWRLRYHTHALVAAHEAEPPFAFLLTNIADDHPVVGDDPRYVGSPLPTVWPPGIRPILAALISSPSVDKRSAHDERCRLVSSIEANGTGGCPSPTSSDGLKCTFRVPIGTWASLFPPQARLSPRPESREGSGVRLAECRGSLGNG
jgi:hypothetical protein